MLEKIVKATIKLSDRQIAVEGPRDFVESMIAKYSSSSKHQDKNNSDNASSEGSLAAPGTEKDLIAAKQPHGHHEIVAVLAFALAEEGANVFTEDDMHRAYIRAGVRPPKIVGQALRDAKNKYEYVELAGKRGKYRLTNHGDRVVRFDLPRQKERSR